MIFSRYGLFFILFTFITSCATPYKHDGIFDEGLLGGYTNTRIDANTIIVSFRGDYFTSGQKARIYTLYRAAEVTVHDGYDYFTVTSASNYNQVCCLSGSTPHSYSAVIKMYQGPTPIGQPNTYDAKNTMAQLGPVVY